MLTPPGWNSIDDVTAYAKLFTYSGWAALFFLLLFEILAHVYGVRKDALVAAQAGAIKSTDDAEIQRLKKKVEDVENASGVIGSVALKAEDTAKQTGADLVKQQERAAKAEKDLLALQEQTQPRHLSEAQKVEVVRLLIGLPAASPRIFWANTAFDGRGYEEDFKDVFQRLGWRVDPENIAMAGFATDFTGIFIVVHSQDTVVLQARPVQQAFGAVGVVLAGLFDPRVPQNTFEIRIGRKK